ncbi:MAG: LLM class flavin-dependent oxidoreductase [Acidobacteria bacterium]|nr:LLM class flavin-dependent oxidoreductase [Acidobacteriota bacterium]
MFTGALRFGILLPTRGVLLEAPGSPDVQKVIRLGLLAEEAGYHSVWVGDSVLARPRLDPLTVLASLAGCTRRVELGTAVLLAALRHPVLLAHVTATLDLLSQGRLILGMGMGTRIPVIEREFGACGVPFRSRVSRFEESIEILKRLWTESRVTHVGRHFQLQDVSLLPKPARKPHPPIWLAGGVTEAYRRAARSADGWLPNPPRPEAFEIGWRQVRAFAQEQGRDPDAIHPALYATLNSNSDESRARAEMKNFMEAYYGIPFEILATTGCRIAGNAAHCVAELNRYVAAGARTLILRFASPDPIGQFERCTEEILPRLGIGGRGSPLS